VQTYVPPHPRPLPPEERGKGTIFKLIIWTLKTKSLLPSLYPPGQRPSWAGGKREELPLFSKEGRGEIS